MDKKTFSFKPDSLAKAPDGSHVIDKKASNPYIMLSSHTQGAIYYTPKTNQYWTNEDVQVDTALFEKQFLPYLQWGFDEIDDKGVNRFPPSPENIAVKRKELIDAQAEKGEMVDYETLLKLTSPTALRCNEQFETALGKRDYDAEMVARIKRSQGLG